MMKNNVLKLVNFQNLCFLFSITVYVVFTLFIISTRVPFFDEVNAWNIAQNCSFSELLHVSRHEGHFLLWYLLIKPFAGNDIGFPISMYIINWIIAFSAVLVLWLKAPFNPFIKTCITFSLPVQMFTIYARCYSIGMLILFILCALYKKRFKHPVIYSFLIIFLANTSVIGTLIAFAFGLLYFIEALINKHKDQVEKITIFQIFFIFVFGVILVLSQMAFSVTPSYSDDAYRLLKFQAFFRLFFNSFRDESLILMFALMGFGALFFKKNIYLYLFMLISNALIIFLGYKIFTLEGWHYMFLFINIIASVWIYIDENKIETLLQKSYYLLYTLMCFCLVFYWDYNWYWNGFHAPTTNYIKKNFDKYENSNIFLYPTDSSIVGIVPSLRKYNINFYDAKGYSYKSYLLYVYQWNKNKIKLKNIEKILKSTNKNSYLFIQCVEPLKNNEVEFFKYFSDNFSKIKIKKYKNLADVIIYKIELKE